MLTYRIRKSAAPRKTGDPRSSFRTLMEVLSEEDGCLLATCTFNGRAALSVMDIAAADGRRWTVAPKRKVMPTSWAVSADSEHVVDLDVRFARSLFNPLQRTGLCVSDPFGNEVFRVMDQRKSTADRLIGSGPVEWMFMRDGEPVGKLVPLARPEPAGVGRVRRLLSRLQYDVGVVSFGDRHVLAAPAALAVAAIHSDLTDPS